MKKALRLLMLLALSVYGSAQTLTTVTATNITNGGPPLASGTICFQATDYFSGKPISFRPGGGGQAVASPYCWPVVNGALGAGTFNVANPGTASPTISYLVQILDSSGNRLLAYVGVNFTGATFNFDNYIPGLNTVFVFSGNHAQCTGSQFSIGIAANGDANCSSLPFQGTVTSVALSVPSWLSVAGSPITSSGTLAVTAASGQTQNRVLATPDGSSGSLAVRALVPNDVPQLTEAKITNLPSDLASKQAQISGNTCPSTQVGRSIDTSGILGCSVLASGDIPNNAANTTGNATTATALQVAPAKCSAGNYPLGIAANGDAASCTVIPVSSVNGRTGAITIVSGDIPNNAANTSGNAGTATALASTPSKCSSHQYASGVNASGNAQDCEAPSAANTTNGVSGSGAIMLAVAPTSSDLTVNQTANGDDALSGKRATDSGPTGNLIRFKTQSNADIFRVDTAGVIQNGTIPGANVSGNIAGNSGTATALAADGSNCSASNYPAGIDASGNAQGCSQPSASTLSNGTTGTGAVALQNSPTHNDLIVNQTANGDDTISGKRKTDTSPTGNLQRFTTQDGLTDLWKVDVTGSLLIGTIPAARVSGTLSNNTTGNANTATALASSPSICSSGQAPRGVDASGNSLNCFTPSGGGGGFGGYGGDGSDGALAFDGSTSISCATLLSSIYTLSRDCLATTLVLNNGVTIKTNGFRLFGTVSITINGSVLSEGGQGNPGTTATTFSGANGGTGGIQAHGNLGAFSGVSSGSAGSSGGAGNTGNGTSSTFTSSQIFPNCLVSYSIVGVGGGSGGAGGPTQANPGGGSGSSGTSSCTLPSVMPRLAFTLSGFTRFAGSTPNGNYTVPPMAGAPGGGGGGGDGSSRGGGGGGGGGAGGDGGFIVLSAPAITISATGIVSANAGNGGNGGNGAPGQGGDAGGGGGGAAGSGGLAGNIGIIAQGYTNNGIVRANGGTGGTGGSGGAGVGAGLNGTGGSNGNNGSNGFILSLNPQ